MVLFLYKTNKHIFKTPPLYQKVSDKQGILTCKSASCGHFLPKMYLGVRNLTIFDKTTRNAIFVTKNILNLQFSTTKA